MWWTQSRMLPAEGEQVIGVKDDEVQFWTRTNDGWYVSDSLGQVGHRDAWGPEGSRGPDLWTHHPKLAEARKAMDAIAEHERKLGLGY